MSQGYVVECDGQAAEIRFACLHTIASRAVMTRLVGSHSPNLQFHREHREDYLERASRNNLVKAFSLGVDIHIAGTAIVLEKDVSLVTPQERSEGKPVTLGRMYKRSSDAIADQYGIPHEVMQGRVDKWDEKFPEFTTLWHPAVEEFVNENGFVTSLFNLVRRCDNVWSQDHFLRYKANNEAVNSPVQGDSHQWISRAVGWFFRNYHDKYPHRRTSTWNDVHDAYISDTRSEELDLVVIKMVEGLLHPVVDHDNYPWVVCDLATEAKIQSPWGTKVMNVMFDTSRMGDKTRPDFNLEDEIAKIWFESKVAMQP